MNPSKHTDFNVQKNEHLFKKTDKKKITINKSFELYRHMPKKIDINSLLTNNYKQNISIREYLKK